MLCVILYIMLYYIIYNGYYNNSLSFSSSHLYIWVWGAFWVSQ